MNRRNRTAEARRSLDRVLLPYRDLPNGRPQKGWIRAVRDALGMTAAQLGARLGVTQPAVNKLEVSETEDTIGLATLRRVAEALDCKLVYALVPREPLEKLYDDAARDLALRTLGGVDHTMLLENQGVRDSASDQRLRRFIEDELDPRDVWAPRT